MDIVEVRRIRGVAGRVPGFLERVFSPEEIRYCRLKKNPWPHFAARFAAKEAVWKALDRSGVALKDIQVERNGRGKPLVYLRGKRQAAIRLSLSHTDRYALAVAVKLR